MHSSTIPEFPLFTKLNIRHQQEINAFTLQFPSYSDFNFTSIFSWDTNETTEICFLNNNLVLKLPDYLTGEVTYSVLGHTEPNATAETLLNVLSQDDVDKSLQFVPETFAIHLDQSTFIADEDRDDYDYIYSVDMLVDLPGKKYMKIRQSANAFLRDYPNAVTQEVNINDAKIQSMILDIVDRWADKKLIHNRRDFFERTAIRRLLSHSNHFPLITLLACVDEIPVAFTISQQLSKTEAIGHFEKADINYRNSFAHIRRETNKSFQKIGIKAVNYEQDLGLEGLRLAKMKYHPSNFLRKYNIKRKALS